MEHGLAKYNPKGCDDEWSLYHPKDMCRKSLRKGACDREECRFQHIRFSKITARKKLEDSRMHTKKEKSPVVNQSTSTPNNEAVGKSNADVSTNHTGNPFLSLQSLMSVVLTRITTMEQELHQMRNPMSLAPKVFESSLGRNHYVSGHETSTALRQIGVRSTFGTTSATS